MDSGWKYDSIGAGYARARRADPRIAAPLAAALGDARSVLNVGAGAGSYEPVDRAVVAVEPSAVMIAQRPTGAPVAVRARAEALPFSDRSFDAVMAVLTLHHWADRARGLRECARVARHRVVLLTWDPDADSFWLVRDYFPEFATADRVAFPAIGDYAAVFGPGARIDVAPVPVPRDCIDGFLGAYWARPHAYLDESVRASISAFAGADVRAGLERLRADLEIGAWQKRNAALLEAEECDLGYRWVIAQLPVRRAGGGDGHGPPPTHPD